jgi:DNA repair protein RecN (Recombination protein N)
VEDLRIASESARGALEGEESGALTLLHSARRALDTVKSKDSRLESIAERVSEAVFILDDAATDLASYATGLEADPTRLDALNDRKSQLHTFIKRWGGGASGDEELVLLAAKAKTGKESIADLEGGDNRIAELESRMEKELLAQGDPRMSGNGKIFDEYTPTNNDGFYEKFLRGEKVNAGWVNDSDFEKQPIQP